MKHVLCSSFWKTSAEKQTHPLEKAEGVIGETIVLFFQLVE